MSDRVLPVQFEQLEAFARSWALATEAERVERRFSSTIEELQAFYDAILPRLEAIMTHLNQFSFEQMPEDARRLFHLSLSLAEIAPAVELFRQPRVPDGFDVRRLVQVHDKADFAAPKVA